MFTEPPAAAERPTAATPHAPQEQRVPTGYKSSTWVGALVFVLVVAVALAVVYVRRHHAAGQNADELRAEVQRGVDEPVAVDVVHVQASPAQSILSLPGEARSFYETTIFARTSGYLNKWFVDIGDPVKEGQVLATIETPELDDQLVAANAKLQELQSEVHVAETAANFAKVSYDRWEALTPGGAVSQQERDQKKAEMDSSNAKLEAAKAQVALGAADVKRLTTLTHFKNVIAPFDGTITQRHVDIGALVTAGSTTNTSPLFSISQADQIRVFVNVPQPAIPSMKVGMPVTATAREFPGRKFEGKLDRTASSVDPASKTLRVEVLVPNKSLELLPGMYLQVSFANTRSNPPVRVPAGAVCFRAGGPQVAVVAADHRVSFKDITISRDLGDYVEVEQGILSPDQEVALNVGSDVSDGDKVDPHVLELAKPHDDAAGKAKGHVAEATAPAAKQQPPPATPAAIEAAAEVRGRVQ
jgi:RND family efflux transporter MFP subunit